VRTVGLKTLKNKLSEYVRAAASGETVLVTDRGRVVAEIVPHKPEAGLTPFQQKGVREGWLMPAKRPFAPLPPRDPISGYTLEQLLADLDRDREDRV
jgi:prevent-host-death family protein